MKALNRVSWSKIILVSAMASVSLTLTACGGGGGGSSGAGGSGATPTYSIGGTLSGLASGQSVVLQDNGGNNLTVSANGAFTFTSQVSGAYAVTVLTQPAGQTCSVTSGGSGTATANVTNVAVACTNVYSVTALVSGLASGQSVVLQDNGGNNLTVSTNGTSTFTTSLATGAAYAVTVLTQPTGQTCAPQSGSGTIAAANVTVDVVCVYTSGDSALDGPYVGAIYGVLLSSSPEYFLGDEGTTTYDGMGGTTGSNSVNLNGAVSIATNPPATYALENGQLGLSGVITGGVEGANQNVVVAGDLTAAAAPLIGVSVKQGSGMSLAGLLAGASSATYISARFHASASDATVDSGTLTINSDGSGSFSGPENDNGTICCSSPPSTFPAGTFTVSSTGGFTMSSNSPGVGGVSPDYDLLVVSNQTSTDTPDIHVAVRTGSGESLATLDGQYTVVAYQDGDGGDNGDVQVVTLLMDGQGHYTSSSGTENSLGTISSDTGSGTYTVAGNGIMTFVNADGTVLNGAVSADGNVAVLYQITSGNAPQIIVGVRQ